MAEPPPEQAADEPRAVDADLDAAVSQPPVDRGDGDGEDDDIKSKRVTLADLNSKGSALYAHRDYDKAADVFSRASVLQAEMNGELDPENAEILFHYGRSLFKVGQSKSDVLGGPAAADKRAEMTAPTATAALDEGAATAQAPAPDVEDAGKEVSGAAKKSLFQFTGDDNFDNSDTDDDAQGADEGQEEQGDDLATAFEILDFARVCYFKKLERLSLSGDTPEGPEVAHEHASTVRHVKKRLADTHDCLAEISLENEQFPNAIEDGRISLKYKMELYPEDSEIVAEAHYKLSLALEFASITTSGDDGTNTKSEVMDQGLRDEAIREMQLAIKSFRLKMQSNEVEFATVASPKDNDMARKAISEMKEVVADMEQRLVDLRKDPIDPEALSGILGRALGQQAPSADAQFRADEAAKTANDLTGMVRKKAKDAPSAKRPAAPDADPPPSSLKKPRLAGGDAAEEA